MEPPLSLVLHSLLQRYPGYKADDILEEDAFLIDDWLVIAEKEAQRAAHEQRETEWKMKRGKGRG